MDLALNTLQRSIYHKTQTLNRNDEFSIQKIQTESTWLIILTYNGKQISYKTLNKKI